MEYRLSWIWRQSGSIHCSQPFRKGELMALLVIGGAFFVAGLLTGVAITAIASASGHSNYIAPTQKADPDTDLDLKEDLAELNS